MAYGHAERALAAIQAFEAETADLLCRLPQLDAERASWQDEVVTAGMHAPGRLAGHDRAQVRPPTAHGPAALRVAPVIAPAMRRWRRVRRRAHRRRSGPGPLLPGDRLLSASAIE